LLDPKTLFAPPERLNNDEVKKQNEFVKSFDYINEVTNSLMQIIAIINEQRQIIFCNDTLLKTLGIDKLDKILGKRAGEALGCIHSNNQYAGCGTNEACRVCGAINATLECFATKKQVCKECRITTAKNGEIVPLELKITVSPLVVGGNDYAVLSLIDISDEKRKRFLENIFFHDVLNTASAVYGYAQILKEQKNDQELLELNEGLLASACQLIEEIKSQRELSQAEHGELQITISPVDSYEVLRNITLQYQNNPIARNKNIKISDASEKIEMHTDIIILMRIIGNMLKNALEACGENETVTIGCGNRDGNVEFYVKNPVFMPRDIQLQIFQRTFSTKSKDRGFGTYSIKLLTEKYLKGTVRFETSEPAGTTFFINLPVSL